MAPIPKVPPLPLAVGDHDQYGVDVGPAGALLLPSEEPRRRGEAGERFTIERGKTSRDGISTVNRRVSITLVSCF